MKTFCSFLLIILSVLTTSISAQEIDTNSIQLVIREVIPVEDQGFVIFKSDHEEQPFLLEFSFFDVNLQLVSSRKVPIYKAGEIFSVEKVFVWNGKLILHGAHYLPDTKKNQLFQYEFSLPDLKLQQKKLVLISKAPDDVYVPYFSKLSPDKTKLVLLGWDYSKPKKQAYIRVRIIDQKSKEIRRQTHLLPYENQRLSIEDVFVNDTGEVYFAGNNIKGMFLYTPKPSSVNHFVLGLFEEDKYKKWEIQKEKYHFQGFKYALSPNGDLIGLGFCEKNKQQGSTFFKINPSTEKLVINTQSVDKEQFKKAFTKNTKYLNQSKHSFSDYILQKIVRKSDGYYLISERQAAYTFEDILVLKLDLEGDIIWSSRIPKAQNVTFNSNIFSYAFLERKEKFYFLFNDDIKNYKTKQIRDIAIATIPKVQLATAVVDLTTGDLKRRPIKNIIKDNYIFLPTLCHLYSKEDALILANGILMNTGSFTMKKIKMPE